MALILDLETTGFPDRTGLPRMTNPKYTDTSKYDNARVLQISALLCSIEPFQELEPLTTYDRIINAGVPIPNAHIHGITEDIIKDKGIDFDQVAQDLLPLVSRATFLVAHNAAFDVDVLKAEAFRHGKTELVAELNRKRVVCTMHGTRQLVGIKDPRFGDCKLPKLSELYEKVIGQPMTMAHDATWDVANLHRVLKKLHADGRLHIAPSDIAFA